MPSYGEINGAPAYCLYQAIKLHFSSDRYDCFKYNFKTKVPSIIKNEYQFQKLQKHNDPTKLIVASIIKFGTNIWIGDIVGDKGNLAYNEYKAYEESLKYKFKSEISQLDDDFNSNFISVNGQHPNILKLYIHKKLSIQTITILDELINFTKHLDKSLANDFIWPEISMKIKKFKPFFITPDFDTKPCKDILLSQF